MSRHLQQNVSRLIVSILFFAAGYSLSHFSIIPSKSGPEKENQGLTSKQKPRGPRGFWSKSGQRNTNGSAPSEEAIENLAAIGYVDGIRSATPKKGVVVQDSSFIQPGLNYYTSGHAPEAILMESNGKVRHKWKMRFDGAFPDADRVRKKARGSLYWRTAHLFDNGDLLAIFEGVGLIKLDKTSRLLWSYSGNAHHAMDVQADGTIYLLTRAPRRLDSKNGGRLILEDFITILDSSGKEKQKISIFKALQSSIYASAMGPNRNIPGGDIFHTNTVEVLDGSHQLRMPFLKKGNILISICFLDMIAVLDPQSEKIIWALTKMWTRQHTPAFLQNGDLILFDNRGAHGKSRVVQINPLTQQVVWSYEQDDFFSDILGASQRLPNGNTLITDSDDGRAFEITPHKKIVWEFFNPERAGTNKELVAVVPEMIRLAPDFPLDWLD